VTELECEITGAGGDVEDVSARRNTGQVDRAAAPMMVQARRHHAVHQIVDASDPVEHRPHLRLGQGSRRWL
jgi:hypothetical protein